MIATSQLPLCRLLSSEIGLLQGRNREQGGVRIRGPGRRRRETQDQQRQQGENTAEKQVLGMAASMVWGETKKPQHFWSAFVTRRYEKTMKGK
ncbi:MAG: hypothetical protein FWF31_11055 [Desulfobulbus sp.]|nr:hypothetical protein [Desulfobulbus sp.]